MARFPFNLSAVLALIVLNSPTLAADQYYGHPRRTGFPDQCCESLEYTIARSPMVLRARLQSKNPSEIFGVVTETIKGDLRAGSRIDLGPDYVNSYSPGDDVLLAFRADPQPLLWRCYALDGNSVVMLMDLQKLTKPTEILAAARSIAANPLPIDKSVCLFSNGRMLVVPQCERLQQLGRQWAAEKSVFKRLLAIEALREFPSTENRELISPFLDDTRTEKVHLISKWQVGQYTVRKQAAELLASWHQPPPEMRMNGSLLKYDPVSLSPNAYVLIVAAALLLFIALAFRRHGFVRLVVCGILLLALLALGALWWRSESQVDELMFAAGHSHHEIASYSGGIQYQIVRNWDSPRQCLFGSFDRELNDNVWSIDAQSPTSRRSLLGFVYASGTDWQTNVLAHPYGLLRIPYWALLIPAMVPLALNLRAVGRGIRRRRLGLCHHCGYDLRASPNGICSECGNGIPSKNLAFQTGNEMRIRGHALGM